jgi:tRNA (mo5U34)-methyltransferase
MDELEIRQRIEAVPYWWHSIPLGDIVTPGHENEAFRALTPNFQNWIAQAIPEDLTARSVLDIGAWDGFFSFLAEERGARRVVAMDKMACRHHVTDLNGFWTAHEIRMSRVQLIQLDVYDIDRLTEDFDVIFFFGVLYHLKHPLLALERLYERTNDLLLLETHVKMGATASMEFYEGDEYGGDPTNWWGPSVRLVEAMCRVCGFKGVEKVDQLYHPDGWESRALFSN